MFARWWKGDADMKRCRIRIWAGILVALTTVGCLLFGLCQFYLPVVEKCRQTSERAADLQARISYAQAISRDHAWYEAETGRLLSEAAALVQALPFPARPDEETYLLFLSRAESETGQKQLVASMAEHDTLYTSTHFTLLAQTVPFSYSATYEGFQQLIRYFVEQEEPCSLHSFTASYQRQINTYTGVLYLRRYFLQPGVDWHLPELAGVAVDPAGFSHGWGMK